MLEHQYTDGQSASDRKLHVGERQRKAEDVFNAPELGNTLGKLLSNKKGSGTHSQTLQIWLQHAFTCWGAAVSHKQNHKEAITPGEVNALVSPGATLWLISTAALYICCLSCPTRLNFPDPPQHLLLLQFSWRLESSEEARAALSSMLQPQRHSASPAHCCGQAHAKTTLVLSHLLAHHQLFSPASVDTLGHPDHLSSSAGVFPRELNGVWWLRTISQTTCEPAPRCPTQHGKHQGKKSSLSHPHSPC